MSHVSAMPPPPGEPPVLIFQWRRTGARWRLGLMIFLALLVHAASFYVLQVAYTPTGTLFPPPARVVLVPLDEPKNASLARWLAMSDPTLITQAPRPAADAVVASLGFRYVPSYEVTPPAFKSLEAISPPEAIAAPPRPIPPGPVSLPATAATATGKSTPVTYPPGLSSHVVFGGGLGAFAPAALPPVTFKSSTGVVPLEPTVFLVGVRAQGGMPFLFPVRRAPANNPVADADEADDFARDYLARLTFRPTDAPGEGVIWGRATFYWGSDVEPERK